MSVTEIEDTPFPWMRHELIPWRGGNEVFQEFIDRLPRITESPKDECPICQEEYLNDKNDTAVMLQCGHIMGSTCLLKWISGRIGAQCPLCRGFLFEGDGKIQAARAEDMRRYLFWLLRSQEAALTMEILEGLEQYRFVHLQLHLERALRTERMDLAAMIQKGISSLELSLQERHSTKYVHDFMTRVGHRAARTGKTVMEWLLMSMRRAAAEWILYYMPEIALIHFTNNYVWASEVEQYARDEKYGANGSEDYTKLPDIALPHVKGSRANHALFSEFPYALCSDTWESVIERYLSAHPRQRRANRATPS